MAWYSKFFKDKETPKTGEIAVSDSIIYRGTKFVKYNPDTLISRKGLQIYDKMKLDDQVKSCLNLKKNAVLQAGWTIIPASDEPQDIEIAEFVEFTFNQLQGTFDHNLKEILSALDYGYSITEKVWQVVEEGDHSGKWNYEKLKTKKPHNYTFDVDEFDNLKPDGLINNVVGSMERLPVEKFVIYSYQKEFNNYYGMSDLRAAYRSWWSKDNIIKFWNIFLERFGSPTIIGKYKNTNDEAKLQQVLDTVMSKSSIVHREGDFTIELLEAQRKGGSGQDVYESALVYHDKGISNALLVPSRVKDDGEGGARAEASVRFDAFLWTIEELKSDVEETIVAEQLIRPLVKLNFSSVQQMPTFKINPLTGDQKVALAETYSKLVKDGAIIPTLEDENKVRDLIEFPEKSEEDALKDEEAKRIAQQPKPQDIEPKEVEEFAQRKTKTEIEKRINFTEIEDTFETAEIKSMTDYQNVLTEQKDAILSVIGRKYPKGEVTTQFIKSLELPKKAGLKKIALEVVDKLYNKGRKDGRAELPQRFATATQGDPVTPDQAVAFLASKADFTVKGINDPLLSDIQVILTNSIQTGVATTEVIRQIEQAYIPYLSDGTVIVDEKQLKPFRLSTIARTTINESYNWGRRDIGEDPDLQGFVIGYQYSEILDERTTAISKFVDRKIIDINHPRLNELSYPLHFNERGVFAYATIDDQPVTFMSDIEIATAISMKGI